MYNPKSLAGLRPHKPGEPPANKGLTVNIERLSDKFRNDMLQIWDKSKGNDRLLSIINDGKNQDVIQIAKLLISLMPRSLQVNKLSESTQLVITAAVPQPQSQPIVIDVTPDTPITPQVFDTTQVK